ncbi:sugar ABC transporter permease [Paenibacillus swuensis]|uniref:Sugar ABC transporter permease n=1 Tax=Paenibacillus swuensis TaxID=1178515 RepID=A0A172TF83_9BACL|nr:sugar ABC transporter permease [Paenibacillus swuensis]ANE45725.1 sugar ABC transporter permease [Paenibacillus swuensis]
MTKMLSNKLIITLFIMPGLLFFACFILIPLIYSAFYSFTNYDLLQPYTFIGLDNYKELIRDGDFYHSLWNALLMMLALIFIQHPIAIAAGMFAQYLGRGEKAIRAVYFLPTIIGVVVGSMVWSSIFSTQFGLLNHLLDIVGLESWQHDWLGDPKTAIWCIILVSMWCGFGYAFLLYYTGLKGIPADLHEAAKLDGASNFQIHTLIDLPMLKPIIKVNVILAVIASLKMFDITKLMTNGGPFKSTHMPLTYMYEEAFSLNRYGYGNAVSITFVVICLLVTFAMNKMMKSEEGEA